MNKNNVKEFFKSNWFWIIIIGYIVLFSLKTCKDDIDIERNGVIVSVTVEYYDRKSYGKGVVKTVSGGYYYVNNKSYKCFYEYEIPKGSTFKIKYNPENPKKWRRLEE